MRNNKRVVLMVEDDKKLREVLTKFLSRNDYEVLAAENGKVGLELFYENSKNLDIVLLDGMDAATGEITFREQPQWDAK